VSPAVNPHPDTYLRDTINDLTRRLVAIENRQPLTVQDSASGQLTGTVSAIAGAWRRRQPGRSDGHSRTSEADQRIPSA
jgi:hypothetical protein